MNYLNNWMKLDAIKSLLFIPFSKGEKKNKKQLFAFYSVFLFFLKKSNAL